MEEYDRVLDYDPRILQSKQNSNNMRMSSDYLYAKEERTLLNPRQRDRKKSVQRTS
jgi:hypothetical protein